MESILRLIKKMLPKPIFKALQPLYHLIFSYIGAVFYRFPSKKLYVIGITGTKGKSSTAEILNAMLEEAGYKTALASTIRFKTRDISKKNLYKMTMPGRFFIQRFMRNAVKAGCTHIILEMTSEGAKQYRHKNIALDALIFTNITPEHIESHGSFENYLFAKLKIRNALSSSSKWHKVVITNFDDEHGKLFLKADVEHKIVYSLDEVFVNTTYPEISFGYEDFSYTSPLQGEFNLYNILAAIKLAKHLNIEEKVIAQALKKFKTIPGRVEYVDGGQNFKVVVDYAHTKDSLLKLYKTFEGQNTICILGNTGGGRDTWKRPEMAKVAEKYCDKVILTDEDPYDEDPEKIVQEMASGMSKKPEIVMDRRKAITTAFNYARKNSIVLITGKGTDPYIMRANGAKEKWSDKDVAEEELQKMKLS